MERAREEAAQMAGGRYAEIRYEDFVADPHSVLDEMYGFCQVPRDELPHNVLDERLGVRDLT